MKIKNPNEEKLLKEYNNVLLELYNTAKVNIVPMEYDVFAETNDVFLKKYGLEITDKIVKLFESKLIWQEL